MEKKIKRMNFLTGVFLMLALGILMAAVSILYTGQTMTVGGLLITAACAFAINFVTSLIIPAAKLGDIFARKFNSVPGSWKYIILSSIIITLIYVTVVSFGMTIINVGFNAALIPSWLYIYPVLIVPGYVVATLLTKPAMALAGIITGVGAPVQQ